MLVLRCPSLVKLTWTIPGKESARLDSNVRHWFSRDPIGRGVLNYKSKLPFFLFLTYVNAFCKMT